MRSETSQGENPALDSATVLNPVVGFGSGDLLRAARDLLSRALRQPGAALEQNAILWQELVGIALGTSDLEAAPRDRRFGDDAWKAHPVYRRTLQSWLAWHQNLERWIARTDLDETDRGRATFLVDLLADAFAPTNFLIGNPAALKRARETRGLSVVRGLRNYLDDLINNRGMPSQVDKSHFTVGGNVANTPGAVVFRNELIELIQYRPTTPRVRARPCFIVPPQINKFYIYDMSPAKSFVRHAVEEGLQVFLVSWRSPFPEHRHLGLDDYVEAIEEAIEATLEITGQMSVNGVGACAGGITFAAALGYFAAAKKPMVDSLTLMVNVLVNSPDDSVMGLFANDATIDAARKRSAKKGVLDGRDTARVFNWMRPNDLIWNYVVSNYLLGESPPVFDILFWNNDTTRLPAQLHSDFLDIFQDNPFREAGKLQVRGQPIDLRQVTGDVYITGGTTDHITPWQACYRSTQLFGGSVTYVLSTAGHIQSIVNPPANSKRKYFLNPELPADADQWLEGASQHDGSWWTHWYGWIRKRSGKTVPARKRLGSREHPVLCSAPGTYVHE